jgi:penicillin-binding protein-related factor A (putative recombinase)
MSERDHYDQIRQAARTAGIFLFRLHDTYLTDDEGNVHSPKRPCDFFGHHKSGRAVYCEAKEGDHYRESDFQQHQLTHLINSAKHGVLSLVVYVHEKKLIWYVITKDEKIVRLSTLSA